MIKTLGNPRRGLCAQGEGSNGGSNTGTNMATSNKSNIETNEPVTGGARDRWKSLPPTPGHAGAAAVADRWAEEQLFEEDVRAVLSMMRPNRRERLQGWTEYRTGGAHFRATVSWAEEFNRADTPTLHPGQKTRVPNMADVIEALLVGSAVHDDDISAEEEFEMYRTILREVYRRLDDLQSCYE